MARPEDILKKWRDRLDPSTLFDTAKSYLAKAARQLVYAVLLLINAFQSDSTPGWAKRIILGTLAYVFAPIDLIPDLTPVFGFNDDMGYLMFSLSVLAGHIDSDCRQKSKDQLEHWFGPGSGEDLEAIDQKIDKSAKK